MAYYSIVICPAVAPFPAELVAKFHPAANLLAWLRQHNDHVAVYSQGLIRPLARATNGSRLAGYPHCSAS